MKNKIVRLWFAIGILAAAGLALLSALAGQKGYEDLMLAVPYGHGIPSYNLKEIEKLTGDDILITYEIKNSAQVQAAGTHRTVTLIGTNSSYLRILGLQTIAGRFLADDTWRMGNRHAVLNQTAAFYLFGGNHIIGNTFKMNDELWMVAGIIEDADEDQAIVYVSFEMTTGSPEVLLVKSGKRVGEVQNSLVKIGAHESNSKVINVAAISRFFGQQLAAAAYIGICLGLLLLMRRVAAGGMALYREISSRSQTLYLMPLLKESRKELSRLVFHGLALILILLGFSYTSREILKLVLSWSDVVQAFGYLSGSYTHERIRWLLQTFYCGILLFGILVSVIALIVGSCVLGGEKKQE